jgi:DNA-binding response OmpR family regulator
MNAKVANPSPPSFTVGAWHVRPFEGVLERNGERRHLRPKSMDVQLLLASSPCSTVPREEFFRQVWVARDGLFARLISAQQEKVRPAAEPRLVSAGAASQA